MDQDPLQWLWDGVNDFRQSLMIFVQELAETFDYLLTLLRMMMIVD
jgi:hypothetical protein